MKKLFFLLPLFLACQGPKTNQNTENANRIVTVTYNISVEGMTCTGCEKTIQNSIAGIDGVTSVMASHEKGLVTLLLNPEKIDTIQIREKITGAGYNPVGSFVHIE